MKIYKINHISTMVTRRGKKIIVKCYKNIDGTDSMVVGAQKSYNDIIHDGDNYRYSCLIEHIKKIKGNV